MSVFSLHLLSSPCCRTAPQRPAPAATAPAAGPPRDAPDAAPPRRPRRGPARRSWSGLARRRRDGRVREARARHRAAPGRGSGSPPRRSWSGLELAHRGLPSRARARPPARRRSRRQEQRPAEARPGLERAARQGLGEGGGDALHGVDVGGGERGDVLERGVGGVEAAGGGGGAVEEEVDEAEAALVGAELPQQPGRRRAGGRVERHGVGRQVVERGGCDGRRGGFVLEHEPEPRQLAWSCVPPTFIKQAQAEAAAGTTRRRSRRSGRKKKDLLRPPNFSGRSRSASQPNIRFWSNPAHLEFHPNSCRDGSNPT
ncbi:hypothetical protein PVAP13_7KG380870 [Panicum virgatum]|uniref:Uncharacterized protein n=1 Tax=Panicum virgatum TaxID=38727 RepID=A0A8T0QQL3_PANVG|nr:hypothetical protein PVAP13_7KG380870 [Panicum virgatum]